MQAQSEISRWRAARRLYPVYSALAQQFGLKAPPCRDLDEVDVQAEGDLLEQVERWFGETDDSLQVHHFRQLLHGKGVAASEEKLHALIERHLRKAVKSNVDRDKLDFLLVQYFSVCAPPSLQDRDVKLEDVAEIMEPVLGTPGFDFPEWLQPIEPWVAALAQFSSLEQLQLSRIPQQGRQIKDAARHLYFTPISLLAFTRFSYVLRRTYNRLINSDLKAIEMALDLLEERGCSAVDCRALELSATTPVAELRHYCENFRKPALPEYSTADSMPRLILLRQLLEGALSATEPAGDPAWQQVEQRFRKIEDELTELRAFMASLLANRSPQIPRPAALERLEPTLPPPPTVDLDVSFAFARAPEAETPPVPDGTAVAETVADDDLTSAIEVAEEEFREEPVAAVAEAAAVSEAPVPASAAPGSTAPPAGEPAHATNLASMIEEIRKRLNAAGRRGISSIAIAGTALLLSADEVEAFLKPVEGSSAHLQRSLAVRALLLHAVETRQRTGRDTGLDSVIQFCQAELAAIQKRASDAKQANRNEYAAALTASANQLATLLRQAERVVKMAAKPQAVPAAIA